MDKKKSTTAQVIQKLIASIKAGRFDYTKYTRERPYFGLSIMTQPTFASYGRIGYDVFIYDERGQHTATVGYDEEMDKLTVDDEPLEKYLETQRQDEFLSKLKALLTDFNAEIDTVGIRVNGQKIAEWSYAEDNDNPTYTDDDVMVLCADNL